MGHLLKGIQRYFINGSIWHRVYRVAFGFKSSTYASFWCSCVESGIIEETIALVAGAKV